MNHRTHETLEECLSWLDHMAQWPPSWNSYNALPPQQEYVDQAKQWLTDISTLLGPSWLVPTFLTGDATGGVCIEWYSSSSSRKLTVYLDEEGYSYIKSWVLYCTHEMEDGILSNPSEFLPLWSWFTGEEG